jgi:hypothetical protein
MPKQPSVSLGFPYVKPPPELADISQLETWGLGELMVACHRQAPLELKRAVVAAGLAYFGGLRSLDYTIRTYLSNFKPELKESNPSRIIRQSTEDARNVLAPVFKRLLKCDPSPDGVPMVAAQMALVRLRATVDAVIMLTRFGCIFESIALSKLILEQTAWAYAIHKGSEESVRTLQPTKAIPTLKTLFPYIGRLYGDMNKFSHMSPGKQIYYLDFTIAGTGLIYRSPDTSALGALFLLEVADILAVTAESVTAQYFPKHGFIRKASRLTPWVPKRNRPTKALIRKYSWRLNTIAIRGVRRRTTFRNKH